MPPKNIFCDLGCLKGLVLGFLNSYWLCNDGKDYVLLMSFSVDWQALDAHWSQVSAAQSSNDNLISRNWHIQANWQSQEHDYCFLAILWLSLSFPTEYLCPIYLHYNGHYLDMWRLGNMFYLLITLWPSLMWRSCLRYLLHICK